MLRRPRAEESDEDLLKMQKEFLEKKSKEPAAKCVRFKREDSKTTKQVEMPPQDDLSDETMDASITEENDFPSREKFNWCSVPIAHVTERNPQLDGDLQNSNRKSKFSSDLKADENGAKPKKKRSLFAQRMAANKAKQAELVDGNVSVNVEPETKCVKENDKFPENDEKLAQMSEAEILEEQRLLVEKLDVKTLEFLRNRKGGKEKGCSAKEIAESSQSEQMGEALISPDDVTAGTNDVMASKCDVKGVNDSGEFIWSSDLPDPDPSGNYSVRFDLSRGEVVNDVTLPTHLGLHHHGEEPEVPGYTIEELFMLCKSANSQQKILALKTLSQICANSRRGRFIQLGSNVFQHLLDSGFAMLTRLMLDQSNLTLICQAVQSLWAIIHSPASESVREVCYLCSGDVRSKFVPTKPASFKVNLKKDPESVMKKDLLHGLVKTNLLNRLRYIVEVVKPPAESCITIIDILIEFAFHSSALAKLVFDCPRLVSFIIENYFTLSRSFDTLTFKCLRFFCALSASHFEIASNLISVPTVSKMVLFCIGNDSDESSMTETVVKNLTLLVKSESWLLCHILTTYNLFMDQFVSLISLIIIRLNRFQLIEITKCSITDVKFVTNYLDFCFQLSRNFLASQMKSLHGYVSDMVEIVNTLLNKWTNELFEDIKYFHHSIHLACISSLWRFIYGVFSFASFPDPVAKFLEKKDLLRHFKLWKLVLDNLQLTNLIENWPYDMTNAESITDCYFCLNLEKCQFYSLDYCNNYLRMVALFLEFNPQFESEYVDFLENLGGSLLPFLGQFMKLELPVAVGSFAEHSCGYQMFSLLIQLVYKSLCLLTLGTFETDLNPLHKVPIIDLCLKCIVHCPPTHSGLLRNLLQRFLLNPNLYHHDHLGHLCHTLSQLSVRAESSTFTEDLETTAPEKQLLLKQCEQLYLAKLPFIQGPNDSVELVGKSLFSDWPSGSALNGPLLPQDWLFFPILDESEVNHAPETDAVDDGSSHDHENPRSREISKLDRVQTCLQLVAMVLSEVQKTDHLMNPDLLFVRLMHVFMMGNEIFMDKLVENLMEYLFKKLHRDLSLPNDCAGLTSFLDFYMSFLEYFEAESFGHVLFSNFVLFPLCSHFSPKYRRAVWVEHTAVFKVLRLNKDELLFPLNMLCEDAASADSQKSSQEVLKAQSLCLSGDILNKCPTLAYVAAQNTNSCQ